jgi:uncharacterized protein (DUF2164 family)
MVPLFSRRSIAVLLLGLIVGALGGVGYWALSPIDIEAGWPPVHFMSGEDLYESTTTMEVFPSGPDYGSLKSLQREGEYYAAKMATSTFLDYLSETLEGHQYYHSASELDEMLMVRYDYRNEVPAVEIRATAPSKTEASYLAGTVPEVFKDYLATQEYTSQLEEYHVVQRLFDSTTIALMEARAELEKLVDEATVYIDGTDGVAEVVYLDGLYLNMDYVVADAEVGALEGLLDYISRELASYNINGLEDPEIIDRLVIGDPSDAELVPPDRVRGRNALMMGAVIGVVVAWLALNRRDVINRLRPVPATTARVEDDDELEE